MLVLLPALPAAADPQQGRKLFAAAARGELEAIQSALQAGADPNATLEVGDDFEPVTPLVASIAARSTAALEVFLGRGALVQAQGAVAVRTAILLSDEAALRLLLPRLGPPGPDSPPLVATAAEHLSGPLRCIWRVMLQRDILTASGIGESELPAEPESLACPDGGEAALAILDVLLAAGYPVDRPSERGSALAIALQGADMPLVKRLLAAAATPPPGWTAEELRSELLVKGASRGDDGLVASLLAEGANPARPSRKGRLALPEAVELGRESTVALLLARGAAPDAHGPEQERPLVLAAAANREAIARALLAAGAAPGQVEGGGWPLQSAVRAGATTLVRLLLEHGAPVGQQDSQGRTVLHELDAAALDSFWGRRRRLSPAHYALPALLKANGFDFAALDRRGRDVLTSMLNEPIDMAFLEALVAAGAPVGERAVRAALGQRDAALLSWMLAHGGAASGSEVLTDAVQDVASRPELLVILLRAGARTPQEPAQAHSLLRSVVRSGSAEATAMVLQRGPRPRTCPPEEQLRLWCAEAFEVLEEAVRRGHPEVVRVLVDAGVSPTSITSNRFTVLHQLVDEDVRARKRARDQGRPEPAPPDARMRSAIAVLLDSGFDLASKTRWGNTVAELAARDAATQAWLQSSLGLAGGQQSALHRAVRDGDGQQLQRLTDGGADLNVRDTLGRTPLTLALQLGRLAQASFLLQRGATFTLVAPNAYQQADVDSAALPALAPAFLLRLLRDQLLHFPLGTGADAARRSITTFETNAAASPAVSWTVACDDCEPAIRLSGEQALRYPPLRTGRQSPAGPKGAPERVRYWLMQDSIGAVPFNVDLGRGWGALRNNELTFTPEGTLSVQACTFSFTSPTCYPELVVENTNESSTLEFATSSGPVIPPAAMVTVTQAGRATPIGPGQSAVFDRSRGSLQVRVGPVTSKVFGAMSVALTLGKGPDTQVSKQLTLSARSALYAALARHHHAWKQAPTDSVQAKTLAAAIHVMSARAVQHNLDQHVLEQLRAKARELARLDERLVGLHRALYHDSAMRAEEVDAVLARIDRLLQDLPPERRAALQDIRAQVTAARAALAGTDRALHVLQGDFRTDVYTLVQEYQALVLEYAQYADAAALDRALNPAEREEVRRRLLPSDVLVQASAAAGRGARLRTLFGLPAPSP